VCTSSGGSLVVCPDAETNALDAQIVDDHFGVVNDADVAPLNAARGACLLCGADPDDNGVVNDADLQIMQASLGCTYTPLPAE
jgi:hypothetical protein